MGTWMVIIPYPYLMCRFGNLHFIYIYIFIYICVFSHIKELLNRKQRKAVMGLGADPNRCAPWLKAMCWNDRAITLEHDPQAQHWMKHINENKRFHFFKTALEQGSCHTHPEPEHHVRWRQHCGFSPPRLFRELEQHGPSLWHTSSHGQTQLLPSSGHLAFELTWKVYIRQFSSSFPHTLVWLSPKHLISTIK